MTNLLKEPLYAATVQNQEWSPEDLTEPFNLEAYVLVNASLILQEWLDYGGPGDQTPNGDHTYTSHNGDDTTQIIIAFDGTSSDEVLQLKNATDEVIRVIKTDGTELL